MKFAKPELALALALVAAPAMAADPWEEISYNPVPAAGDVILPLPCGGAMAFRAVDVPGEGPLADRRVVLGARDAADGYKEAARPAFVGGTFPTEGGWRYYLGKYEVSGAQHAAMSGGECPDMESEDADLPAQGVTMAEAMLAAERWAAWLAANGAEGEGAKALAAGGFPRLPTEEEWEFAARGGAAVSEAEFADRLPPMEGGADSHVVYCADTCEADLIGARAANPLGLHDMIGNVAELTSGVFTLRRRGRAHGGAGAYVKRGGDFRAKLAELHSGMREEFTPTARDGLRRQEGTGYRLAFAAPALPDLAREAELRAAWADLAEAAGARLEAEQADPKAEVAAIAGFLDGLEIENKKEVARRVRKLSDVIETSIAERNEERARAAQEMLRVAILAGLELNRWHRSMDNCAKLMKIDSEKYAKLCERRKASFETASDFLIERITKLVNEYPQEFLAEQFGALNKELKSRDRKAVAALPVVFSNISTMDRFGVSRRQRMIDDWRILPD